MSGAEAAMSHAVDCEMKVLALKDLNGELVAALKQIAGNPLTNVWARDLAGAAIAKATAA